MRCIQLFAAVALLTSCAPDPGTAVLTGLTTDAVLDELEDKVNFSIGQAAQAGSLAADAAARNALLTLEAARATLNDDLDKQWDKLESEKVALIKQLQEMVSVLDQHVDNAQTLQQLAVLDAEALLDKFPFISKAYAITRIEGATQWFRDSGHYRILLRGNPFVFDGRRMAFTLNGKAIPSEYIGQNQNHQVEILLPAKLLASDFEDSALGDALLGIEVDVPKPKSWYEVWKGDEKQAVRFETRLRTLPKFPIEYRIEQFTAEQEVDKDQVLWWPSRATVVGGCGKSGCYLYHNVIADLPNGAVATGKVRNCTDSFSGWGQFVRQNGFHPIFKKWPVYVQACGPGMTEHAAIQAEGSTVMMLYQQHSHNQTRTVQFEAGYYPLKKTVKTSPVELKPLTLENGTVPAATPPSNNPQSSLFGLSLDAVAKMADTIVTPGIAKEDSQEVPPPARPQIGRLRYGQTYEARLSPNAVGWTITMRTFNGDNLVASEAKADPQISAQQTDMSTFKRVLITPKAPF